LAHGRRRGPRVPWSLLDACCGLLVLAACTGLLPETESPRPGPTQEEEPGFDEADTSIDEVLLHFDPGMVEDIFPVYRDLAQALAPETRVAMAVPHQEDLPAAQFLLEAAGFPSHRCRYLVCDRTLTIWARDRVIPLWKHNARVFFRPLADPIPEEYSGDLVVADMLARWRGGTTATGLYLEGGNIVVGTQYVFVGRNVLLDNAVHQGGEDGVRSALRDLLDKEPLILGDRNLPLPHDHIDMYLTVVGPGSVLLGDPAAGAEALQRFAAAGLGDVVAPSYGELSTQQQLDMVPSYEAIRVQLLRAHLKVHRIPIVHTATGLLLTWNNALVERRGDGLRAYVPVYGIPLLDDAARDSYKRLGFRTFPVNVARIAQRGGTVRCVTNVLEWRRGGAP